MSGSVDRSMARDRPSPYGNPGRFFLSIRSGSGDPELQSFIGPGTARDRPSPYGNRAASSVGQDRLKLWHICQAILTRSGAGAPELRSRVKGVRFFPERGACLRDVERFMKHPQLFQGVS